MRGASLRLIVATALFVAWFLLLLLGYTLGGAVHLVLLGALGSFPWRRLWRPQ